MQFVYHKNAGEAQITLNGEVYHHIFRVRHRRKVESLTLRNLKDTSAYIYEVAEIDKKSATLLLRRIEETKAQNSPKGHLVWAMIEPKCVEKTIPFLNELNLSCITFFYADFSQKQFKLDLDRIHRILENSSEQCGRITRLNVEILENLDEVLRKYPKLAVMDFCEDNYDNSLEIPLLIGPEGGFSQNERNILKNQIHFSATNCNILRSETAAIYAASRIL